MILKSTFTDTFSLDEFEDDDTFTSLKGLFVEITFLYLLIVFHKLKDTACAEETLLIFNVVSGISAGPI